MVIGSWHVEQNTKACEMYDINNNEWIMLPELNYATCAPGLIIIKGNFSSSFVRSILVQVGWNNKHQEDRVLRLVVSQVVDHSEYV